MKNNLNRTKSADAILLTIIFLKFNFDPNKKDFSEEKHIDLDESIDSVGHVA